MRILHNIWEESTKTLVRTIIRRDSSSRYHTLWGPTPVSRGTSHLELASLDLLTETSTIIVLLC